MKSLDSVVVAHGLQSKYMLVLLIVLILLFGGVGAFGRGHYRNGGIGLGTILIILLIVMLLRGGV